MATITINSPFGEFLDNGITTRKDLFEVDGNTSLGFGYNIQNSEDHKYIFIGNQTQAAILNILIKQSDGSYSNVILSSTSTPSLSSGEGRFFTISPDGKRLYTSWSRSTGSTVYEYETLDGTWTDTTKTELYAISFHCLSLSYKEFYDDVDLIDRRTLILGQTYTSTASTNRIQPKLLSATYDDVFANDWVWVTNNDSWSVQNSSSVVSLSDNGNWLFSCGTANAPSADWEFTIWDRRSDRSAGSGGMGSIAIDGGTLKNLTTSVTRSYKACHSEFISDNCVIVSFPYYGGISGLESTTNYCSLYSIETYDDWTTYSVHEIIEPNEGNDYIPFAYHDYDILGTSTQPYHPAKTFAIEDNRISCLVRYKADWSQVGYPLKYKTYVRTYSSTSLSAIS